MNTLDFKNITNAIENFKKGEFIIVMDDDNRENEGDLILAAGFATSEKMNFMIRNTTGIICCPMTQDRANQLKLHPMTTHNTDTNNTHFTVTCDAKENVTTGVSSSDRSSTAKALANMSLDYTAFNRPGHIFPLVAKEGGILVRRGHTEAAIDLCKLANISLVGVIGELMNNDGTMSRYTDCEKISKEYNIPIITIEILAQYKQHLIEQNIISNYLLEIPKVRLISKCGLKINNKNDTMDCVCQVFWSAIDNLEHVVLLYGISDTNNESILVRIHSECFTGNILHSLHCDCHEQFEKSLEIIKKKGSGIVIYHNGHEGRGIGLANKIKTYDIQQRLNLNTIDANKELNLPIDSRDYQSAYEILKYLKISKIDLITNNPTKIKYFENILNSVINLSINPNQVNNYYLETKKTLMNHDIIFDQHFKKEMTMFKLIDQSDKIINLKIAVIKTQWNREIVESINLKYIDTLIGYGVQKENIYYYDVPGSFELPFQAKLISSKLAYDVIICIGVIIKGETPHFEYISSAVTSGIMNVQLQSDIPIIFGVLTCTTIEQALERSQGKLESASGWANSTIKMALNTKDIKQSL